MRDTPRWLAGAARSVRSSDRLTALGNKVVGGVQGNRLVVDAATRVFGYAGGVPLIYLKGGVALEGVANPERLPVVLVNAVDVTEDAIEQVLDEVAALQRATLGFRPVVLVSVPCFRAIRAHGWPMELVVPQHEWDFALDWNDYLAERLAMIATRYRTWASMSVVDGHLEPRARRIVQQLATYRPWEASVL